MSIHSFSDNNTISYIGFVDDIVFAHNGQR